MIIFKATRKDCQNGSLFFVLCRIVAQCECSSLTYSCVENPPRIDVYVVIECHKLVKVLIYQRMRYTDCGTYDNV